MNVASTCPYCGVGCGVRATRAADRTVTIAGDPLHPANFGRLCSKGAALADTLGLEDRLLYPEIDGKRVSWDTALAAVCDGLRRVRETHGPGAVAFYVSGQLLTEDYYVANKLMKGFLGTGNIDTNSRLCMASAVAGQLRAFGADAVPCSYEDLEAADLIVLVGSNTAWCHPVVFDRIRRAKEARPDMKIVSIDPRRTPTAELSDMHLALAPGTDAVLFNGLLNYLRFSDRLDLEFLEARVEGFAAAFAAARSCAPSIPIVARACGLNEEDVAGFYHAFGETEKVVTLYSQGINQSANGTDRVNSIINCHLATGRIGRRGMGPFSITGQPNAMGGREVGGLANQLAAHMGFAPEAIGRMARFWNATGIARAPGLKAVDMFEAIERGNIKAIWIMATNPAVSLPDADRFRATLRACELVVVSDCVRHTDTNACAHILLPAAAWGEKDGTVTNSERRISRQRAFLDAPGEAKPDWWIITQVARRLGFAAQFPYEKPADIFREHARLSGFENDGTRAFDISGLADLSDAEYDALVPVQWPVTRTQPRGTARLFADPRFYHPSGKARMLPIAPNGPVNPPTPAYPLALNTGRVRDQWHTMTRTGRSARLLAHRAEPYVEVHPDDARAYGVNDGSIARVSSKYGEVLARVRVSKDQRIGSVFVPIHWSDTRARHARVGALVNPITDPISGQPELKHTPVRVSAYVAAWHAFVVSRDEAKIDGAEYCVKVKQEAGWRYELAGDEPPARWPAQARRWLGGDGEWLEFEDIKGGRYRAARIDNGRLTACLFVAPTHELPARGWPTALLARDTVKPEERLSLLSGREPTGSASDGPMVCVCFGVGRDRLVAAIRHDGLTTTQAIGLKLGAGTNCGSCLPELKTLIASNARQPA
ncbi:MAG: molybdopterin-dependent oxidoreductase [Sulfurifustis sp.]